MRGLFRYLSPFASDQSGAASVLYGLGGMVVILDAGGCAGNICGFDEPRWFTEPSAVYSACMRDLDAILGRDDRTVEKIKKAAQTLDAKFIALIGTPVPAVVGIAAIGRPSAVRLLSSKMSLTSQSGLAALIAFILVLTPRFMQQ